MINNDSIQVSLSVPRARHGEYVVFDSLDFPLVSHQWTAIVGVSGVGKTTLLRSILTLLNTQSNSSRGVSLMGQQDQLLPWLTVERNICIGAALRGGRGDLPKARRLAAQVGLGNNCAHYPHELSAGMRQRVALARTLYEDTDVVLLDEPFGQLDALTRRQMYATCQEMLKGKTVVMVSHDLEEVTRLSGKIYVMKGQPAHLENVTASDLHRYFDLNGQEAVRRTA